MHVYSRMVASIYIEEFKQWLHTSESSYFYVQDVNGTFPIPNNIETIRNDLSTCPKWIMSELLNLRREQYHLEKRLASSMEEISILNNTIRELEKSKPVKSNRKIPSLKLVNKDVHNKPKLREKKKSKLKAKSPRDKSPRDKVSKDLPSKDTAPNKEKSPRHTVPKERTPSDDVSDTTPRSLSTPAKIVSPRPSNLLPTEREELRKLRGEVMRLKYLQQSNAKRSDSPRLPDIQISKDEEENEVIDFEEAKYWMDETTLRVAVSKLFLKNDLALLNLIGKAVCNGPNKEKLVYYLVTLYKSQNKHIEVLENAIHHEIESAKSVNTLFRGEDFPCRLLRVYIRLVGKEYVNNVFADLISEVSENNYHYEIDPIRLEGSPESLVKQNFESLEHLTQRFLNKILSSLYEIPPDLIRLCKFTCDHARKKFHVSDQTIVAGFMFLRFICPAITSSESFGFSPVQPMAGRTLLLVGKIIQNLANGADFKEEYLFGMNAFLERNSLRMSSFCNKLKTYPVTVDGDSACVMGLTECIYSQKDRIIELVDDNVASQKYVVTLTTRLDKRLEMMNHSVLSSSGSSEEDMLVSSFVNVLMDNEESITQIITSLISSDLNSQELKVIVEDLVIIFQSAAQTPFLARIIVQQEVADSEYLFLHQSFTKLFFVAYTKRYCHNWLKCVIGDLINNIITQNIALEFSQHDFTHNSLIVEKLKKLSSAFMETIISSLNNCPKPLWCIMNSISLGIKVDIFKFIVLNFIANAIESPFIYKIASEKPRRESSNSLKLIADVIRNIANGSSVLISDFPMDHTLAPRFTGDRKSVV